MKSEITLLSDKVWHHILDEARTTATEEPLLRDYLVSTLLNHDNLNTALSHHLANKLASIAAPASMLRTIMSDIFSDPDVLNKVARDIQATVDRDSACTLYSSPFLYFKGFLSLQAYRAAHHLWTQGKTSMALLLQHRISVTFAVDIHPAAMIGSGVMIDHATGLVIGETAVTLGGTGKDIGDRHPKIRKGVLIGPGATILGNIEIGEGAMVAASSVVLKAVAPHTIVAGVPAVAVGDVNFDQPSKVMNHYFPSS
jgi:serine O-acetyltransferase